MGTSGLSFAVCLVGFFLQGHLDFGQFQAFHSEQAAMALGQDLDMYLVAGNPQLLKRQVDCFFRGLSFGFYMLHKNPLTLRMFHVEHLLFKEDLLLGHCQKGIGKPVHYKAGGETIK